MQRYRFTIAIAFIVLLSGILYLATLRGAEGNPTPTNLMNQEQSTQAFELSPERGRFAHVVALADTKQYALSKELADFVYPDVGWYEGRFYSFFAPGLSYMVLPFYELGNHFGLAQVFTFGFISFVSILSLIAIFFIAKNILKLPIWAAFISVLIFGFGSTAWSYAVTLYQHQLTVFFMLTTFYAAWKYRENSRTSFIWGGWVWLGYALAITIDYPNAILLLPVMIYFLVSAVTLTRTDQRTKIHLKWSFVFTSLLFILVSGLHLYHNQAEFGSWKRLSGSIVSYKTIKERKLDTLSVANISHAIATTQENKGNVVTFFSEQNIPHSFGTLMFSTDRGLLFYGPIFIFGLLGLLLLLRAINPETTTLMGLVFVNIFLYSSWGDPWGGWAYGTRYLIPSMAVLSLFAGYWFVHSPRAWISRILALPFFAYSSAVALVGALTTNAVPPRVEAVALHSKYNYLFNIDFLKDGKSGSFIYNTYAHNYVSLLQYYEIIYFFVLAIFIFVIILLPLFKDIKRRNA